MLIYNHEKKLIGIDEKDLNYLGFKNLAQLLSENSDFADLFVKRPGFIHNFQHVHWIDFVNTASDVDSISEVIINANSQEYQAELQIEPIYLNDEPTLSAFLVYLKNLRKVDEEIEPTQIEETDITEDKNISDIDDKEVDVYEEDIEEFLDKEDEEKHLNIDNNIIEDIEKPLEDNNEIEDNYVYNPVIASQELGLPVDLVEEFIQDFIKQANEFKSQLYTALENDDIENVKALSHKLKGVAANLRVDDVFDILTFIKDSQNKDEITKSIDKVYRKIDKLALRASQKQETIFHPPHKEKITPKIEIENLSDDIFLDVNNKTDETNNMIEKENEPEEILETIEVMYDKEDVANKLGISSLNFTELFHDFIMESKILSNAIHDAILEDNSDSWTVEAIKLKGMSTNMHLYDCVKELDKIIKTKDKKIAQISINKIDSAIESIANA